MGDAFAEPGRVWDPAGCHPSTGDAGNADGWYPQPGRSPQGCSDRDQGSLPWGSPLLAPSPARARPVGIPAWCQAALCHKVISVFALVINTNCKGFIDQLGEVLPCPFWRNVECKQSGDLGSFPAKWGGWRGISSKIFMVGIT